MTTPVNHPMNQSECVCNHPLNAKPGKMIPAVGIGYPSGNAWGKDILVSDWSRQGTVCLLLVGTIKASYSDAWMQTRSVEAFFSQSTANLKGSKVKNADRHANLGKFSPPKLHLNKSPLLKRNISFSFTSLFIPMAHFPWKGYCSRS